MQISTNSLFAGARAALIFACFSLFFSSANAQLEVDDEGNVRLGNMTVSSEGDVDMPGLSTDSEGNVALGDISVSADGSVIMPSLRVETNGSVSFGSEFDADTLSEKIEDPGQSANVIILFEFGSAELTDKGEAQVEEVADAIRYLGSNAVVEIQGHTDSVGSDADNLDLSMARANRVVLELKEKHDVTAKLTATGKGESEPVADNNSDIGRQLNRRVTLVNRG